jgi:hypothetical protein
MVDEGSTPESTSESFQVHFEMREMPVYSLVVAKGGAKLNPAKTEQPSRISTVGNQRGSEHNLGFGSGPREPDARTAHSNKACDSSFFSLSLEFRWQGNSPHRPGCSNGVGRAATFVLAENGYRVRAGVRKQEGVESLLPEAGTRRVVGAVGPIILDVIGP